MKLVFDIPPLTRLLGMTCFLSSGQDAPHLLSRPIMLLLDGDVYPGHPAAPVATYALEWWSNPEEDAVDFLSPDNLPSCLEYHRTKRIQEGRPVRSYISGVNLSPARPEILSPSLHPRANHPEATLIASTDRLSVANPLPDSGYTEASPFHVPYLDSTPSPDRLFSNTFTQSPAPACSAPSSPSPDRSFHDTSRNMSPSPDRHFHTMDVSWSDNPNHDFFDIQRSTYEPIRTPSPDRSFNVIGTGRSPSPSRNFSDILSPTHEPLRTPSPERSFNVVETSRSPSPDRDFFDSPGPSHEPIRTPSPDRSFNLVETSRSHSPNRAFLNIPGNAFDISRHQYDDDDDDDDDSVVHGEKARPSGPYTEDMFANIPRSMLD